MPTKRSRSSRPSSPRRAFPRGSASFRASARPQPAREAAEADVAGLLVVGSAERGALLPGLDRRQWLVELPVTSRMVLDERMLPTGESEPVLIPPAPLGERTFDDAFDGFADPAEFAVAGAGRRVAVRFLDGYRFAQVYAPPWASFISCEPMTAPMNPFEDSRTPLAPPGSTYRARHEIAVADEAVT